MGEVEEKSKGKIMWLTDNPMMVTGYATISQNILNGLTEKGYDCHCQAHNYVGQTLMPGITFEDGRKLKFKVMGNGKEAYSKDLLMPRIQQLRPDIFGILLDTFMLFPWYMELDYAPAKTVFYFPSDGGGFPLGCENVLKKCNYPVAMSKFGQKQVWDDHKIKVDYIPHAVDVENYRPLTPQERQQLKVKWGLHGKFVVGSVFRNQGRKMCDRQMKAFAKFAKNHPDAVFLMHTDPSDVAAVFNLMTLIQKLGIQNRVKFTGMNFFKGFTYKEMNDVYNVMDIFFLSTSGEGFGVPTIEAAACGIPSVITDYTTTQELLMDDGQCGIPVPIQSEMTGNWNVERGLMDIDKGAEALEILYNNPTMREQFGAAGRAKVLKNYSWEVVNKQWDNLFQKIINDGEEADNKPVPNRKE